MKATIVYWYGKDHLRRDGGGLRALAWEGALKKLGMEVEIQGVSPGIPSNRATSWQIASRWKQALLPLPLNRHLEPLTQSDLIVNTVPITFPSFSSIVGPQLIFDWMDAPSTIADNSIRSPLNAVGLTIQGYQWRTLERRLTNAHKHTVAGYSDYMKLSKNHTAENVTWLPTPVLASPVHRTQPAPDQTLHKIGMIANFDYRPNLEGFNRFMSTYGQQLKEQGKQLVVAGYGAAKVPIEDDWMTSMGEVGSASEFYDRVASCVVPIYSGGGMKVKAIEALSFGKTVYATDHVRDGFSGDIARHLLPLSDCVDSDLNPEAPIVDLRAFENEGFVSKVGSILNGV